MLRFYLIATVLVVGFGTVAIRNVHGGPSLSVQSQAGATLPPRPDVEASSSASPEPFAGDAPWVMAALPGCFEQTERVDGPAAYVKSKLPVDAKPLESGADIHAGDCVLSDAGGTVTVVRGSDRFNVTGEVSVYRRGGDLITYRERGQLAELRTYRMIP